MDRLSPNRLRSLSFTLFLLTGLAVTALSGGCSNQEPFEPFGFYQREDFHVARVRINPSFTKVYKTREDLDHPDRIDVYVELFDQFDDQIKATGKFRFEFYTVRQKPSPDPRGHQFANVLIKDTVDPEYSQNLWDKITRCFVIPLEMPKLPDDVNEFELILTFMKGVRLEDSLIIKLPGE